MRNDGQQQQAISLMLALMRWEMRDTSLDDRTNETLEATDDGHLMWTFDVGMGGPIRITCAMPDIEEPGTEALVEASSDLVAIGREAYDYSSERVEHEQSIRKAATSLLQRKAASGVRLVSVVSQPIPVDYYQNIGVEVTLGFNVDGSYETVTFNVWTADELRDAFDRFLAGRRSDVKLAIA